MKRIVVIVGSTAAVVVIGVVLFVALRGSGPSAGEVTCPTYVWQPVAESFGTNYEVDRWKVYSFEGTKGAPKVRVGPSSVTPNSYIPSSCELKITWAPETPGSGSDWRIGHIVPNLQPLRGRTVTFRVLMKGSDDFQFDTAQIYVYDGVKVDGAWVKQVTPDWKGFQVTTQVSPGATTFEVWIRLLLDKGTVRPGSGSLYLVPGIEVQPA